MKFKFYEYEKCSTCIKARKWLSERNLDFECIPIHENPPSAKELERLLVSHNGERKKLLNTSSKDYRDPSVKNALPQDPCNLCLKYLKFSFSRHYEKQVNSPILLHREDFHEWE